MTIYFYSTKELPYAVFSNFYPRSVEIDGVVWPTSEHFYQAGKHVLDPRYHEAIRQAATPRKAFDMGRDRAFPYRSDWNHPEDPAKHAAMRLVVLEKFSQHQDLQEILLSTGDELIVEDSPVDYYWGCGADGYGKNMLGRVLMEVRGVVEDSDILGDRSPLIQYRGCAANRLSHFL